MPTCMGHFCCEIHIMMMTLGDYESMNKLKEAMSTKEEFYKYYVVCYSQAYYLNNTLLR